MTTVPIGTGGGWISGPMSPPAETPVSAFQKATGPEYSPSALVVDIRRVLAAAGLDLDVDGHQLYTATIAAADLLRALGVDPVTAPLRP